jgi:hypothetical protein
MFSLSLSSQMPIQQLKLGHDGFRPHSLNSLFRLLRDITQHELLTAPLNNPQINETAQECNRTVTVDKQSWPVGQGPKSDNKINW